MVKRDHDDVVKYLLSCKADLELRNGTGAHTCRVCKRVLYIYIQIHHQSGDTVSINFLEYSIDFKPILKLMKTLPIRDINPLTHGLVD